MTDDKNWFGDWLQLVSLGAGGQGEVFLARKVPETTFLKVGEELEEELKKTTGVVHTPRFRTGRRPIIDHLFDAFTLFADSQVGALKVLRARGKAKSPKTAKARFAQEVETLRSISHPALIRLLDSDPNASWFVMEYHARGTLSAHPDEYVADFTRALHALRPIVEGVASLHDKEIVHRDIKPDNVFLADDGRLILGDFGLAMDDSREERLTQTYENVGSRDWMPTWAQGKRLDDVSPAFDVFSLGKLLWAMLSGRSLMPLYYFQDKEFDLEGQFPSVPDMQLANQLLAKCIVEREADCLSDAAELLTEIDTLLPDGAKRNSARAGSLARSSLDDVAVTQLKTYLVDEKYRIQLEELVNDKVQALCDQLAPDSFPVTGPFNSEEFFARVTKYETLSQLLVRFFATGCYYGKPTQTSLWVRALERVAPGESDVGIRNAWTRLELYPALLMLYGGGVGALAADKYPTFAVLALDAKMTRNDELVPIARHVVASMVMERNVGLELPDMEREKTPVSQ